MATTRPEDLIGKPVLLVFKRTHFDRAGETGMVVAKYGEVIAIEESGWVVIAAEEGETLRCPVAKLHRVPRTEDLRPSRGEARPPDYVAAEELIRDFHSVRKPLVLRWLGRKSALALGREAANT